MIGVYNDHFYSLCEPEINFRLQKYALRIIDMIEGNRRLVVVRIGSSILYIINIIYKYLVSKQH